MAKEIKTNGHERIKMNCVRILVTLELLVVGVCVHVFCARHTSYADKSLS